MSVIVTVGRDPVTTLPASVSGCNTLIAPVSERVVQLLVSGRVNAGFATRRVDRPIRASPHFLLSLRDRPQSPLAQRLKDVVPLDSRATRWAAGRVRIGFGYCRHKAV